MSCFRNDPTPFRFDGIVTEFLKCDNPICGSDTYIIDRGGITKSNIGTCCNMCGDVLLTKAQWDEWITLAPVRLLEDRAAALKRRNNTLRDNISYYKKG